jgi:alkanesulfonate monooxygenase SsuD/methylene tetrahydromethanopterin reductase-like flavin-dependent oxidoreductase (luciferase family)
VTSFADSVGVVLGGIGVTAEWWLASAERLDAAGYRGIWAWDHFHVRAGRPKPVLEAWTLIAMAATRTRRATVGPLVANVMNRHPAVLASMAATLASAVPGRLVLGFGIGGAPREHEQLGIPFPPVAERVARLEEAVAVIRALWGGEAITRPSPYYPLSEAQLLPAPQPTPRIVIGGQSSSGARLAARLGDGWATRADLLDRLRPVYLDACVAAGHEPGQVLVSFEDGRSGVDSIAGTPWAADPDGQLAGWRLRGADSVVLTARTTADVDALIGAAAR